MKITRRQLRQLVKEAAGIRAGIRAFEKDLKDATHRLQAQGDYYFQEDNARVLTKIRGAFHDAIRNLDFPNVENKKGLKEAINDWVSSDAVSQALDDLIKRVAKR